MRTIKAPRPSFKPSTTWISQSGLPRSNTWLSRRAGQRLELGLPAGCVQAHVEDVALDVEVRVVLPGGITEVERRRHRDLPVARKQVQLGIDIGNEFAERDGAIENRDAAMFRGISLRSR